MKVIKLKVKPILNIFENFVIEKTIIGKMKNKKVILFANPIPKIIPNR